MIMGFWSSVGNFFRGVGALIAKAVTASIGNGLRDEIIEMALSYVRVAATKFVNDDEKRAWVLKALMEHGIPKSIASLSLELAYQLLLKELGKLPSPPPLPPTSSI